MRDADRIIGLLEANELRNPTLILNRLRIDLVQRGEMMNIEDVEEILAIDILGVVPDDESIVIATNKGEACRYERKFQGRTGLQKYRSAPSGQ